MEKKDEVKNIVELFPGTEELTPEQEELHQNIHAVIDEQDEFIQQMVILTVTNLDEMAVEKKKNEPDFQVLVHMPIEAMFTASSTFLNEIMPKDASYADSYPQLIEELTSSIGATINDFYDKNGEHLPAGLSYYGLLNAAIMSLRNQRAMYAYHQVTGEPIECTCEEDGGTDNDKN